MKFISLGITACFLAVCMFFAVPASSSEEEMKKHENY